MNIVACEMIALKALKSRREGIEKINKITRAMEAIAATRLQRYETSVTKFRPFTQAQRELMKHLALRLKRTISRISPAQNKTGLVILISSDRGFCGSFNNQLFQVVQDLEEARSFSFVAVGKKGAAYLRRRNFNLIDEVMLPAEDEVEDFAQRITEKVISFYRMEAEKIYLIFNKFRRNLLGRGTLGQLFPLEEQENTGEIVLDYLFEPDIEVVLEKILPMYVNTEVKAAILESKAAEEMARMIAMTQARRSAEDLIKNLTLQYHKARQAGITQELLEITNAI